MAGESGGGVAGGGVRPGCPGDLGGAFSGGVGGGKKGVFGGTPERKALGINELELLAAQLETVDCKMLIANKTCKV